MAIELDGKPLKFTAEFDSSKAEQDLDSFLRKLQSLNTKGLAGDSSKGAFSKSSSQYKSILSDATQSFEAFNKSAGGFYSQIAKGELSLQKIKNEQNLLNRELRDGLLTESEYVNKTARLTQLREQLSKQLKENRNDLSRFNNEASRKPAFTRKDTLNELANAHGATAPSPTLSATDAFAKATQDSMNKLNKELLELDANLKKGAISNDEYAKSSQTINQKLKDLTLNQEHFSKNVGKPLLPTNELTQQKSILDAVSSEYREMVSDAKSAFQAISPEARRLNNELVSLRQENKNLSAAQKELTLSFDSGKITQQQYISASRDLGIQQREVKNRIGETQKAISLLDAEERRSIGSIAEKTAKITQLKVKYDQLSEAQRNNSAVGGRIRREYQDLSNEVNRLNGSLSGTKSNGLSSVFSSIRGIAGAMGIAFGTQQLVQFGMELFNIAKQAEGIELRFAKIGDTAGLEKLRAATKNTVSDLELMKQAVRADNFSIPMDVLAKGLQFATQRANETGESVDYLVQSFTTGLGRKSKLILDNLGISIVELNAEIERTGDFATAVGNIIDREMAKSGQAVDTLSEKTSRLAAEWNNFKKALSINFSKIFNPGLPNASNIEKLTEGYKKSFDTIKESSSSSRDEFIKDSNSRLAQVNKELSVLSLESPEFKKIYDKQSGFGGKSPTQLLNDLRRPLVEQQQALQASLTYAKGITEEMAKQDRHSKNIFSQTEVEDKLSEANLLYKNSVGDKARASAKKDVDKWQKLYDSMSIKSTRKQGNDPVSEIEKERQAVERLLSLQLKVDQINEGVKNSNLSRDEQEVESIRNKYKQIKEEIEKFERDPKNKGKKVDQSGLDKSMDFEISETNIRQGTKILVKELNKNREIYNSYFEFVEQNGEEAANNIFGNQANVARTFRSNIEAELKVINDLGESATQAQKERKIELNDILESLRDQDFAKELAKNAEALSLAKTFGGEELKFYKQHAETLKQLGEKATKEQIAAVDKVLQDNLQALIESTPEFEQAMAAIGEAGRFILPKMIDQGKEYIQNIIAGMKAKHPELSAQLDKLEKEMIKPLDKAKKNAKEQKWEAIGDAVIGFEQLVNQAANFDESLGNSLRTIADMMTTVGSMGKLFGELGGQLGKSFAKLGSGLPIIGAITGIIGTVLSIFEGQAEKKRQAREKAERYAQDYQLKQIEAITKALEYQLQIVKDIYGTDRIKAYEKAIKDSEDRVKNSVSDFNKSPKYSLTGDPLLDSLINNRNAGKKNALGLDKLLDGFISKGAVKKIDLGFTEVEDITQEHLTKLYKMLEDGSLDEPTKTQVQSIIDSYKVWKDATNQLKEELLGISFKGILDLSSELFFNSGEDAGNAFSKGFQNIMRDFVKNQFKREFLELEMQKFYDKYDELAKDGLTAEESNYLKGIWDEIEKRGKEKLENLQKDLGVSLNDDTSNIKAESGIERITRQDGSELVGLFRSTYDVTKQHLLATKENGKIEASLLAVANSKLVALNQIQVNTARTVERLDVAVSHLYNIDKSLGQRGV